MTPHQPQPHTDGWQTMETAPRHYKPIYACDVVRCYEGKVAHNGAEWELISHDGFPMGVGFYPTHWRPLPDLPKPPSPNHPITPADEGEAA